MKKTLVALIAGAVLLPSIGFAHDVRRWDNDGRRERYERVARPGDPGYYCHRHPRSTHRDDARRHCHNAYNDPHRPAGHRGSWFPWWRR
jgi:hypothetical protein